MNYKPLTQVASTPPLVNQLIRNLEKNCFSNIHTLLALPVLNVTGAKNRNFAITQLIVAAISGISVTLYAHNGSSGKRFKNLLIEYFPWDEEPDNGVSREDASETLYSVIRNPLTHDLGIDIENKRKGKKIVLKRKITSIEKLESLERPTPLSPTIRITNDKTVVLIESLYWGTRKMTERLLEDKSRMQNAENFLINLGTPR